MTLTAEQQQTVEQAFERFLRVYHQERRVPAGADPEEREQAEYEAMREGVAAVLFPNGNAERNGRGPDRDNGKPITEAELLNGYGAEIDRRVRQAPLPHALRRDATGRFPR